MTLAETLSPAQQPTRTYYRARYYSENDARFMSPDWSAKVEPVPYAKLGDPQSLNLYGYMLDSPLDGVDQDGHVSYFLERLKNVVEGHGWATNAQREHQTLSQTAKSHIGSMDWGISAASASGVKVGKFQIFRFGSDKTNQFVGDTIAEQSGKRPEVNGKMPTAHQWADPKVKISGWSSPKPLSDARPGAVIAQEHGNKWGHVGIVVGPGQTVSADAYESGAIVQNNWGFRPAGQNGGSATDPPPVVRLPEDQ